MRASGRTCPIFGLIFRQVFITQLPDVVVPHCTTDMVVLSHFSVGLMMAECPDARVLIPLSRQAGNWRIMVDIPHSCLQMQVPMTLTSRRPRSRADRQLPHRRRSGVSFNHLTKLIDKKLANLSASEFTSIWLHSAVLLSWCKTKDSFPEAEDMEQHVEGGWKAKKVAVEEWETSGDYTAIIQVVKDIANQDKVQVYTVCGREEKFEVFVLARLYNGLIGVKAKCLANKIA